MASAIPDGHPERRRLAITRAIASQPACANGSLSAVAWAWLDYVSRPPLTPQTCPMMQADPSEHRK